MLERGITLPNTGKNANIDQDVLKVRFVRSKLEMSHNVNQGTFPIFGYPLVCYSPENKEKPDFWQVMFNSAMKKVEEG